MAQTPKPAEPEKTGRLRQFAQTYQMASRTDRALGLWVAGSGVLGLVVGFVVLWLLSSGHHNVFSTIIAVVFGLMCGLVAALVVFSRRAQSAVYHQMEGQLGAGAGALGLLKRGWHVDNAIAFTKQQDVVHRVVGPPGIILVGEGTPGRLKGLMTSERRRHERVAVDTPVHEIVVGNGEGEVPLRRLARHIQKMKRQVQPAEITDILARLKAIDASRPAVPMPKGPVPTSMKGLRGNVRGR
jgi:hypothetical protein